MSPPLAVQLAEWSGDLGWERIPEDLRARARLWVLDAIGLMLAAVPEPPGRAALELARRQGQSAESTLVDGGERVAAPAAALAHGILGHTLDFDDTFPTSVVHAGSIVVPTALAVGEAAGADGRAVLTAVVAGYEIAARLGTGAGRGLHARGFHASGIVGPLVAAAVAAKLYGLPARHAAHAMGLGGSMAGGLLEFLSDGSWSKRLHPGWAAHGGVLAAQLAGAGFPGPASVLEGRYGLYAAFLGPGTAALEAVTAGLGQEWQGRHAHTKLYPCAHVIHPFLDAARTVRQQHAIRPDDIVAARCRIPPWQAPIVCVPREEKVAPVTEYQARASLPFALATALVDGRVDLDAFTPEAIRRPELLSMARRVTHREEPSLEPGFGGELEVTTRTRDTIVVRALAPRSPTPAEIHAKFRSTASRLLAPSRVAALEAAIAELPATTPRALVALCRRESSNRR